MKVLVHTTVAILIMYSDKKIIIMYFSKLAIVVKIVKTLVPQRLKASVFFVEPIDQFCFCLLSFAHAFIISHLIYGWASIVYVSIISDEFGERHSLITITHKETWDYIYSGSPLHLAQYEARLCPLGYSNHHKGQDITREQCSKNQYAVVWQREGLAARQIFILF